jgi:hypothetical protein
MLPVLLLLLASCTTTTPESGRPEGLPPLELGPIEVFQPRPEAGNVPLVPTFSWRIPRKPNRVNTILFNLYRADAIGQQADFIRVFDGPIDTFRLDQGQEGMPTLGIGPLQPHTDYVWRLSISYTDVTTQHTGEWRFRTGAAPE